MTKIHLFSLLFAPFAAFAFAYGQTPAEEKKEEIMIDASDYFVPENQVFNDRFEKISQLDVSLEEIEITIYNKWGEVMYTGNLSGTGWDGKYDDQLCPEGFYYWSLKWKNDASGEPTSLHRFWLLR